MRLCALLPLNLPIFLGITFSAPTTFNTIFWQFVNQTYNAGLNYGQRNATSTYTTTDCLIGYGAALASAITASMSLRLLTNPLIKTASGGKKAIINAIVGYVGCGCAGFANLYFMRQKELTSGISV